MKSQDARNLSHDKLTELRRRAVTAVQNGESPEDVARVMVVNRASVYGWLALYRNGGWDNLDAKKRGGRKPKLDAKALRWIYQTVTLGNPNQLKMPFVLWSTKLLAAAIEKKFGVKLSKASVCRLLHQLGLSPQRPLWRAYQRDPQVVERWLKEEYPAIRAAARKAKGEVWFGDEAGVRSDAHSGTTWAPKGQTPIISTTGARFGLNVISAVNRRGALRFMCVEGKVNADVFIEFLGRLVESAGHPVYLVVDGHPTHKAAKTRKFVESTKGRLKLFFLPGYSPDLNPDERVWNNLKSQGTGKRAITGPDQLKKLVLGHLRSMQKDADLVRSFYRTPSTEYAA
ncbi:MAG: IS630 family transposase [Kiritimatiellae bacterium]|nr:IS630 family transposase [Kiritimatiellia bacterium]